VKRMHAHVSGNPQTLEWLTPPGLVQALGPFDLDPCAPAEGRRVWPTAALHYSLPQDGLKLPWEGRVWCNPPYGKELERWVERMAHHQNGIALIFARTETQAFNRWIWPMASAMLFLEGRIRFHRPITGEQYRDGGAPSVLVAYDRDGIRNAAAIKDAGIPGAWLDARRGLVMVPAAVWSTWRDRVLGHLRRMGSATLGQVYEAIAADPNVPAANNHVQAKVRQTLYLHAQRDGERWRAA